MVALQNLQKEGGKMKKGKQVSIRLTEEEYDFIQSCLGQGESSVTGFIYHAIQYYIESIGKQIFITSLFCYSNQRYLIPFLFSFQVAYGKLSTV